MGCCRLGCPSCPSTKHTQMGVRVREDRGEPPPQEAEHQGLPHSRGPPLPCVPGPLRASAVMQEVPQWV